jgi:hypothetical protein
VKNTSQDKTDAFTEQDLPSKLPLHTHSSDVESIQARLKDLESENLALRERLWRFQYRGTFPTSIILMSIGAACLLISYIQSSLILTFIGLGLILWGVLIIYMSPSRHVRAELLTSISSTMHKSVDNLVTYMGFTGEVVYFHPKSMTGLGQGYIFIPHYAANIDGNSKLKMDALNLLPYNSESTVPQIFLDSKGMFLAAPAQGILDLLERELGANLATVNLDFIQRALPKLLIEELKLVDDMSIEESDTGDIVMRVAGGPCIDICHFVNSETRLGNHLGCPLCSVLALVISKVKGKPVSIQGTAFADNTISTTFVVMNP